jgi:hypothetical protein
VIYMDLEVTSRAASRSGHRRAGLQSMIAPKVAP